MSEFANKLAALCSREAIAAKHDPERLADMVERLTHSLAFTISIAAPTSEEAQKLITGVETHLYESATCIGNTLAKFARPMNGQGDTK